MSLNKVLLNKVCVSACVRVKIYTFKNRHPQQGSMDFSRIAHQCIFLYRFLIVCNIRSVIRMLKVKSIDHSITSLNTGVMTDFLQSLSC